MAVKEPVDLPDEVVDALATTIRREIRSAIWLDPPQRSSTEMPHDFAMEETIMASIVDGALTHDELDKLRPSDFYTPLYSYALPILLRERKTCTSIDELIFRIGHEVVLAGGRAQAFARIGNLAFVASKFGPALRADVARLKVLAMRRRAIKLLRDAEAALRDESVPLIHPEKLARQAAELIK